MGLSESTPDKSKVRSVEEFTFSPECRESRTTRDGSFYENSPDLQKSSINFGYDSFLSQAKSRDFHSHRTIQTSDFSRHTSNIDPARKSFMDYYEEMDEKISIQPKLDLKGQTPRMSKLTQEIYLANRESNISNCSMAPRISQVSQRSSIASKLEPKEVRDSFLICRESMTNTESILMQYMQNGHYEEYNCNNDSNAEEAGSVGSNHIVSISSCIEFETENFE